MMNKMIVANLVHRPIRSLISIVAIALEVALILLIAGLCYGIMNDSKNRTAGIGADVIVQPPGSSFLAGHQWRAGSRQGCRHSAPHAPCQGCESR